MLERILRATVRFHDTAVRGRVLNRFGKDMENMDSTVADSFGRVIYYFLNITVTFSSIIYVGGWKFAIATAVLFLIYLKEGRIYRGTSRDMRRLDSTTKSPLYALYSEVVSGVQVLRAYGASTQSLRLMLSIADTNTSAFVWFWCLNRWISMRFNILSSVVIGLTGVSVLVSKASAAQAGFALAFAASVSNDLLFVVRRVVALEQSMVAMERIKEYSEVPIEGPEVVEPRPPASWPRAGEIEVKDLVIRYAPDLPDVLHNISFTVKPSEKVGIVGATGKIPCPRLHPLLLILNSAALTGCGKSTLALSLFRFVEPTEGSISIDGISVYRGRVTWLPRYS
jgi:ABC-type multidrug transport system fused ATPase/permease subunit